MMDAKVQGYVTELREQLGIMSDRAAQLSAALTEERHSHELTRGRLRSYEDDTAKDAE